MLSFGSGSVDVVLWFGNGHGGGLKKVNFEQTVVRDDRCRWWLVVSRHGRVQLDPGGGQRNEDQQLKKRIGSHDDEESRRRPSGRVRGSSLRSRITGYEFER